MQKPIQRMTRCTDADEPIPPSELDLMAQKQAKLIADSPFLSQFTKKVGHIDRLETCRQQLDFNHRNSKVNELIRMRARQLTGEQMADNMLSAMSAICTPCPDRKPEDDSSDQEKLAYQFGDLSVKENAYAALGQLIQMFERGQKASIELASRQIPKLHQEILDLATEYLELSFAVQNDISDEISQPTDTPEEPLPDVPEEIRETESSPAGDEDPGEDREKLNAELDKFAQAAWEKAQGDDNVIKMDMEDDDEPDDPDLKALVDSLPEE